MNALQARTLEDASAETGCFTITVMVEFRASEAEILNKRS